MYNDYFGFRDFPFSISPDPHFLFMSDGHRDALAHLLYGIENDGGIVLLTGEVGTGKTTLCRCLLEQLPEDSRVAYIINPPQTPTDLLLVLCREFDLHPQGQDSSTLLHALNVFLLACHGARQKVVLVIDEAQNLSVEILEQLRLLTNLETNQRKLLQVLLLGQLELHRQLSLPALRQLGQRVTARFVLSPLSKAELALYVSHRLSVVGGRPEIFPASLIGPLWKFSSGIPRIINLICDRALLGAYAEGKAAVTGSVLRNAAKEIFSAQELPRRRGVSLLLAASVFVLLLFLGWQFFPAAALNEVRFTRSQNDAPLDMKGIPLERAFSQAQGAQHLLLSKWTSRKPQGELSFCDELKQWGLHCFESSGNLGTLERYNRPAVVRLLGAGDAPRYALLDALDGDLLRLQGQGASLSLSRSDFERHWDGSFLLLWRKPPLYSATLAPGAYSPLVPWLDAALNEVLGLEWVDATPADFYSSALAERVRQFQLHSGLRADGMIGRRTLVALNTLLYPDSPQISRAP